MYSIVCPTMWRGREILSMLPKFIDHPLVDEIFLFDNDQQRCPISLDQPKIKAFRNGRNNFVNPCWNLGIMNARNERCILYSDDVMFDIGLLDWMSNQEWKGFAGPGEFNSCVIRGATLEQLTIDNLELKPSAPTNIHLGWAMLLFVNKSMFVPIPHDLQVFFGDHWMWELNKHQGHLPTLIEGLKISSPISKTLQDPVIKYQLQGIYKTDHENEAKYPLRERLKRL